MTVNLQNTTCVMALFIFGGDAELVGIFLAGEREIYRLTMGSDGILDVRNDFIGDVDTYSISGAAVIADYGDGTALIDISVVSRTSVTVGASNVSSGASFDALLDVRNPLHSIIAVDDPKDRELFQITTASNGTNLVSYVAPGANYVPVGAGSPDAPSGVPNGTFTAWDAVNGLDINVGSMVFETQSSGAAHEWLGASIVQEAGQQLTLNILGNGRNSASNIANRVRAGLANGVDDLGVERLVSAASDPWLETFVIPATPAQRQVWISVRVHSVTDFWAGIGAIWAEVDTGVAGDWVNFGSGGPVVLTGTPVTYHWNPQSGDDANDGSTEALARQSPPGGLPAGSNGIGHGVASDLFTWRVSGTAASPITFDFSDMKFNMSADLAGVVAAGSGLFRAAFPSGADEIKLDLYQGTDALMLAQLPRPALLRASEVPYEDYVEAAAMTGTTIDGGGWFAATFANPSSLVGQAWVRVWNNGNNIFSYPVTAYDAVNDRVTFDITAGAFAEKTFIPYSTTNKMRFAVVNHPECMTVPGQWYRDLTTDEVVMRGVGDADLTAVTVSYPGGDGAIRLETADHILINGARDEDIVGVAGAHTVLFNGCANSRITDMEIVNSSAVTASGGTGRIVSFENATACYAQRVDVRDGRGRGFFYGSCTDTAAIACECERLVASLFSSYTCDRHFWLGCFGGLIYDAHGNVFTNTYQQGRDVLAIGCSTRSNKLALTQQSTRGGCGAIACDFVTNTNGSIVQFHNPTNNSPDESGDGFLVGNTIVATGGGFKALFVHERQLHGLTSALNVIDGYSIDTKQSLVPNHRTLDQIDIVDGGSGHDYDIGFYAVGGTPVLGNDGSQITFTTDQTKEAVPPTLRDQVNIREGGRYASPADLPANPVSFAQTPAGTAPLQVNATWKAYGPAVSQDNYLLGIQGGNYKEHTLVQMGDVDGSASRGTIFTNFGATTPIDQADVTLSGAVDPGAGAAVTIPMPTHALFPSAPAQLTLTRRGAFNLDGSRTVDWSGWQ